jgi:hypothetical protein
VYHGSHIDLRAYYEVPNVRNGFQERGDRITKRLEEARAEAASKPRNLPTIVQFQLQSLIRKFEKVAEVRRQEAAILEGHLLGLRGHTLTLTQKNFVNLKVTELSTPTPRVEEIFLLGPVEQQERKTTAPGNL